MMRPFFMALLAIASLLFVACSGSEDAEQDLLAGSAPKVNVSVSVIADSLNQLSATHQVAKNANARDFLKQVFQMQFADAQEKFVTGIAGWQADKDRREFWSLEVNGAPSQVGISEVKIEKQTEIVWRLKRY